MMLTCLSAMPTDGGNPPEHRLTLGSSDPAFQTIILEGSDTWASRKFDIFVQP